MIVGDQMRKSTSNGRKFELIIKDYLEDANIPFEEQPKEWPDRVSSLITPDFRIDIQPTLWVFAQQDFYNGGFQRGRLDYVTSMDKYAWHKNEVFYVVRKPGATKPDAKTMTDLRIRREVAYEDLSKRKVVGTIDQLMERIYGPMSKN